MNSSDMEFENRVRQIARHLWPSAAFSGSSKEGGRERDGIFITEEMAHLIECTTSRSKAKAEQDARKLTRLADEMTNRYPTKGVKGYFITRDEPTADQRDAVEKIGAKKVWALSYSQFLSMIIDAESYLDCRMAYPFGSMQDPETESRTATSDLIAPIFSTPTGETFSVGKVVPELESGRTMVLLGDYGAGKSTALRELFDELRQRYLTKKTERFPVHINLRDHHGQDNPAEALERHARNVGFNSGNHLVRAWNSGFVTLLLDGFDEFVIAGWSGRAKKLREIRYDSMALIRGFIRSRTGCGIIVAGREHYFDSETELARALGLGPASVRLRLDNFTDEQIQAFLTKKGWDESIPEWLPSRPLLLSYLCSRGMLADLMTVEVGSSAAAGWGELLERISDREAEIEAGIDGQLVRQVIENLATQARTKRDGMGPLSHEDIVRAFQNVCGFPPDDRGLLLLGRLPGLGAISGQDGFRDFIDSDLADAARAGDVFRYIENPFSYELENPTNWQTTLGQLGREVVGLRCYKQGYNSGNLRTALNLAGRNSELAWLCVDLIQVSQEITEGVPEQPLTIRDVLLQDAAFGYDPEDTMLDYSGISFRDCWFHRLEITVGADPSTLPRFYNCYVGTLDGRVSNADLPEGIFDDKCVIDSFGNSSQNTAAILNLPIPSGTKVMLTILKKIYLQSGAGRKHSALLRGLDHRAKLLVPDLLELLVRHGMTVRSTVGDEPVWLPVRSHSVRVRRLVSSPIASEDPLVMSSRSIGSH